MTTLPEPDFIERDPAIIEAEAIATFEAALGKTLFPGQAERLLLNALVYRELLTRIGVQYAAQQNLVNYAVDTNLDQLGALLNTPRLTAQAAQVQVQFTRAGSTASPLIIPDGTRVGASGSTVRFALDEDLTIAAGQVSATGTCTATTTGTAGNGFTSGQIATLIDPISGVTVTVSNTSTSAGGADAETDDRYRARVKLAPEKFSVAGSVGAYRFYALSADSTIIDVAITVDDPPSRVVNVYPLTSAGLPTSTVLDAVEATLDADTVRPLTDIVNVATPTEVNYNLTAVITPFTTADTSDLQAALEAAAQAFADGKAAQLGQDIVRSQIIAALSLAGVYSVNLTAPAADVEIDPNEWPNVGTITITLATAVEG